MPEPRAKRVYPGAARRLAVRPFSRQSDGTGGEALRFLDTGDTLLVPAPVADLLAACTPFRTVEEHAMHLGRTFGREREGELQAIVSAFGADGLLLDLDDLLDSRPSRPEPPPVTSLGFVTCDRPALIERAVGSWLANASTYGRSPRVVVADDTRDLETRQSTQRRLAALAQAHGAAFVYLGLEEKRLLARAIARAAGVDPRIVDFALFDVEGCGATFGGNRNALLLATAGELVVSADDDTVCLPVRAPDSAAGLGLVPEDDPEEYWFFEDVASAIASGRYVDTDVLGEHERLLGRDLRSVIARAGEGVALDRVCSHVVHGLATDRARVLLTLPGVLGESGMHSGAFLLGLGSPTRDRLLASESAYARALQSRAILRAARTASIAHPGRFAGAIHGLDNRSALAPFFPVLRNEDGVFAALLRACFADGYVGYPSHALLHDPPTTRSFADGAYLAQAQETRMSGLLFALVGAAKARSVPALGSHLAEIAGGSVDDFRVVAQSALEAASERWTAWLSRQLRIHDGLPGFWANDMKRLIELRHEAQRSPSFWLPTELRADRAEDEAAAVAQRLVRRYGELLVAWNDLVAGAVQARDGF